MSYQITNKMSKNGCYTVLGICKNADMKDKWFDYVIANKIYWGNGWTTKKLDKVKVAVLLDADIMFDLLQRHGAETISPEQMKATDKNTFDHCIGNFVCNIHYKMMDLKLIKG